MELKPAYKSTEVGMIPEDWKVKRLKDLFTLKSGFAFSSAYFSEKGPILLTPGNFKLDGGLYFNDRNTKRYSGTYASSMQFEYDDLLIVMTDLTPGCNLLGKPAFVHLREPLLHNQRIGKIELKRGTVAAQYLYWYFLSDSYSARMKETATGSTVRHTSNGSIYNCPIPLPPTIAEQEAIAETLSDADALIKSLEQLIAKKRLIKQGVIQELLTGRKRLPAFCGEWKETMLGQLGKCYRGVSYNPGADLSGFDTGSTVRLLRSNNVQESKVVFVDMQFVDSGRVSEIQRLRINDILICMANGSRALVGKAGRFSEDDGFEYTFGAFMGCFRPASQAADPDYVFYLFQTEKYRAHVSTLLAGSSINNLRPGDLEALPIPVATDKDEQTAIAAVLSDMDAEIAALEAKLAKARRVKQGMMHNLLTGRIRLI